jgi:3-deoxy-7-phosphoheptulonate synthase / chorismate mutase
LRRIERMDAPIKSPMANERAEELDTERIADLRSRISEINMQLLELLEARGRLVREIMTIKGRLAQPAYDPQREREMLCALLANSTGVYPDAQIEKVFSTIFAASLALASD